MENVNQSDLYTSCWSIGNRVALYYEYMQSNSETSAEFLANFVTIVGRHRAKGNLNLLSGCWLLVGRRRVVFRAPQLKKKEQRCDAAAVAAEIMRSEVANLRSAATIYVKASIIESLSLGFSENHLAALTRWPRQPLLCSAYSLKSDTLFLCA
jgi:hypothetical protein